MQVTKFREYLNIVEDEQDLIKTCNQICIQLKEELELIQVKTIDNIINIMKGDLKDELQAMGVSDKSTIIRCM